MQRLAQYLRRKRVLFADRWLDFDTARDTIERLYTLLLEVRYNTDGLRSAVEAIRATQLTPRPAPRIATLMLLWQPTDETPAQFRDHPCFASVSLPIDDKSGSVTLRCEMPVPAGAWLVAVNCHLRTVLVGNDVQDLAMPDLSPMVRLRHPLPIGMLLRAVVVPS